MTREVAEMTGGHADFVARVAAAGAEVVRERFSVDALQACTLLIEGALGHVYPVSPRGLVAWLRAHADMGEASLAGDHAARAAAVERLESAILLMMDDHSLMVQALGRRKS